ncbi:MAG: PAS domain-containing hybrid sensor histidine kinase/response regulator [Sphingobacteriaceae bacterium]|nr:MAG: PAS domain-containing hybrid sensor histidine kinase/response regulator [Sphingobacteriaceae bacterium]
MLLHIFINLLLPIPGWSHHMIEQYHTFYDMLPELVWVTDAVGKVIFLNQCYTNYVGISDFQHHNWLDGLHPDDIDHMSKERTVAFEKRSSFHTHYRLKDRHGVYKWFLSRASPTFSSTGEIVRWFGVNTNIDDKVQAIEREKRQNVFFASSVHDIKQPLAGIIGLTEMLLLTNLNAEQRSDLDAILQCGTNVISLTANLLDFCKLESKKLTLEVAPYSLEQLLRHLVKMTKLMKQQNIVLDVAEELQEPNLIEGDYGRVNQIFTNIVTNAAKFTAPDGTIQIDVRLGPRRIDSDSLESQDSAPIVAYRPYVERRRSAASAKQLNMNTNIEETRFTVMVVEDNHITRNIVKRLLEKNHIRVIEMADGQSAIDAYPSIVPDLDAVLLDLRLPDMKGSDVLTNFRLLRPDKRPVIIAFTASGENEVISGGFDGVIYKPFRQDDFMLKLHNFIETTLIQ